MTNLTDRQLANFAYAHCKIPQAKWAAHWALDLTRSKLSDSAKTAYTAIYRSVYRSI